VETKDLLARRIRGVEMSGIRKMFDLAGEDSVNMGLGEPDYNPAPHVIDALEAAARSGKNGYGPSLGIPELRNAIANNINDYRHGDVTNDNVIVTSSATQGLMAINQTFVDHGDEVLIPDPGFVLYGSQAKICGGVTVEYNLTAENDFLPDVDDIQAKITPRTKLMVMNTPGNPTGACMTKESVRAICEIADDNNIIVIADEVYDQMVFDGEHHSFLSHMDNVIWTNSFSKTYAMTGWRLGCIAASEEYVKAIEKMHYFTIACPPTPIQHAGVAALEGPQDQVHEMLRVFRERRDVITKRINEIRGLEMKSPGGAFYALPKYDFDIKSEDLAMTLAKEGMICTPGSAFGKLGENHLRFSYATSVDEINRGMDILARVCDELPLKN
jgi:aspartate aminotransferase